MASKSFVFIALCFFVTFNCINALEVVNGRIKITVGTTSGCGDTVNFITTQLAQAYEVYHNFLDVEFVPWGRTVRHADDSLTCQFGPNDCWANRLHRCALNLLSGDQLAQMLYMTCEFSPPHPSFLQQSYYCANAVGLNLRDVDFCVNTGGRPLDDAAQEAARDPMAIINFVPSIVFNGNIDVASHNEARFGLRQMVCLALSQDPTTGVNINDC